MTRAWIACLAAALLCTFCVGCTIKTDSGTDGGTASEGGTQTVGDQCAAIYTELCSVDINQCGATGFTLDQCVSSNEAACCTGSVCNETSKSPSSAVDACKSAIDVEGCYAISIDNIPAACQGVPQKP